jgi:acyl-CoA thioester hydrolase
MDTSDASTPEPEGLLLRQQPMRVRWGDMDALGHVNNTVYFRYFEQIRIEWIEELGFGAAGQQHGPVIVDAHAEFLKPIVFPAQLDVRMGGHSPGRSSFVTSYTISIDGLLYTRGHSRVVWVDHMAGRSAPLPTALRVAVGGNDAASK